MASLKMFVLLSVCVAAALAYPQYDGPSYAAAPSYSAPAYKDDYKPSYANGRVKIQVYRGPNKEYGKGYDSKGYDDGAFAPWGFYVTQPEDNKPHYGSSY